MSFLSNTFFSMGAMPKAAQILIDMLPLTQASAVLRSISWGEGISWWRILVIAGYNVAFLVIAIHQINKMKNI